MRLGVLLLLLFFPQVLAAQESSSGAMDHETGVVKSSQADPSLGGDANVSAQSSAGNDFKPAPTLNVGRTSNDQTKQGTKPKTETKPKVPLSMVGYVDDAIVESQIRIRFDDAFDDRFPDRSEYFYAKCSCYRGLQNLLPAAYDPNAPGPGPGVPKSINYQQLYIDTEYSPLRRFSLFAEVPIRWLQPQGFQAIPPFPAFGNQAGLSDVQAGFKFAAIAAEKTYLTFQFRSYFPSGDSTKGLGTNHYSIEPSLLFYEAISDRFTLEGQVGDWHPIGGSAGVPTAGSQGFAGDIFFYGFGPSYKLYRKNQFEIAPVFELFGWHVLSGFQTQPGGPLPAADPGAATDASGMNIVNLKFGLRMLFGFHNSIYVGFGQTVTHNYWYKHLVRLEYRYTF
jgi:hypothetical protein